MRWSAVFLLPFRRKRPPKSLFFGQPRIQPWNIPWCFFSNFHLGGVKQLDKWSLKDIQSQDSCFLIGALRLIRPACKMVFKMKRWRSVLNRAGNQTITLDNCFVYNYHNYYSYSINNFPRNVFNLKYSKLIQNEPNDLHWFLFLFSQGLLVKYI